MPPSRLLLASLLALAITAADTAPTQRSQEVRFPAEPGVTLAGTLTIPSRRAGPYPVVVVVLGTGRWTRGGFAAIRAQLLLGGVATLIYDKRGLGRSTGTFADTIPVMERDVAAAVAFLRTRPEIDRRRIAMLGISQGAVAAPAIAARDPEIAAVAALSGPVGERGETFTTIMRSNLAAGNRSAAEQDRIIAAVTAWMNARSRDVSVSEIARLRASTADAFAANGFTRAEADRFTATLDTPVVLSMYAVAPGEALRGLRAPILMVYGTADEIIAPSASYAAAQNALSRNPDALVVAVPGADHGLALPDPGLPEGADPMASAATRLIAGWLLDRLQPRP